MVSGPIATFGSLAKHMTDWMSANPISELAMELSSRRRQDRLARLARLAAAAAVVVQFLPQRPRRFLSRRQHSPTALTRTATSTRKQSAATTATSLQRTMASRQPSYMLGTPSWEVVAKTVAPHFLQDTTIA